MDLWTPERLAAAWTLMSLLWVCSHEVTVTDSDLKLCEDDRRVCVMDLRDCDLRPPASRQKNLNVSCSYQISVRTVSCDWTRSGPDVSLSFSSDDELFSCQGLFSPLAVLNVTARIKNYVMGTEIWSRPHTVVLYDVVKPSQPVLAVLGSSEDSVIVSWRSNADDNCCLRYRVSDAPVWTQAPDLVLAHQDQTVTYTIKDLLTFTIYRAAVACRGESGIWSDWSDDVIARTLNRVPSRPPEVCYRLEKPESGRSFLLHLMWKDLHDGAGLGYQVSYEPVKKKTQQKLQDRFIQNVTEVMALLLVEEGNCSVTVAAFNTAGYGPAAHLSIDTQTQNTPPSVRHLWVSSSVPVLEGLLVQWENPTIPPTVPPLSHLAVQWRSESRPSTSRWTRVDNATTAAVIRDVDPDESYLITVIPVYNQRCGAPQSLPSSLQHGALMEAVQLKVVGVTKTTVTVAWVWQRKAGPIRVNRYSVRLRKDSESQTMSLWPDQWQLTFLNLNPNTEYSLLLLADDVSRSITPVKTHFDELPAVAAVTPLLLLALTVFIISILSRTLYRSFFFPPISSPRGSTTGQWLMDTNHQKTTKRNILDMEDFQVTDLLGEKSLITIAPNSQLSPEEDTSLLSMRHLNIKRPDLQLDPEYVSDAPVIPDLPLVSLQFRHTDYLPNWPQNEASCYFPQTEDRRGQVDLSETSHQRKATEKCPFHDLMENSGCAYQMTCEDEYVANTSFLGKMDA